MDWGTIPKDGRGVPSLPWCIQGKKRLSENMLLINKQLVYCGVERVWDWRWGGALFLVALSLFPVLAFFLVLSVLSREVER